MRRGHGVSETRRRGKAWRRAHSPLCPSPYIKRLARLSRLKTCKTAPFHAGIWAKTESNQARGRGRAQGTDHLRVTSEQAASPVGILLICAIYLARIVLSRIYTRQQGRCDVPPHQAMTTRRPAPADLDAFLARLIQLTEEEEKVEEQVSLHQSALARHGRDRMMVKLTPRGRIRNLLSSSRDALSPSSSAKD